MKRELPDRLRGLAGAPACRLAVEEHVGVHRDEPVEVLGVEKRRIFLEDGFVDVFEQLSAKREQLVVEHERVAAAYRHEDVRDEGPAGWRPEQSCRLQLGHLDRVGEPGAFEDLPCSASITMSGRASIRMSACG